jgi:hypothetical protein
VELLNKVGAFQCPRQFSRLSSSLWLFVLFRLLVLFGSSSPFGSSSSYSSSSFSGSGSSAGFLVLFWLNPVSATVPYRFTELVMAGCVSSSHLLPLRDYYQGPFLAQFSSRLWLSCSQGAISVAWETSTKEGVSGTQLSSRLWLSVKKPFLAPSDNFTGVRLVTCFKLLASREPQPSRARRRALEQRAQARLRSRGRFSRDRRGSRDGCGSQVRSWFFSQLPLYLEKNTRDFSKSTKYFILLSSDHAF